MTETEIDELCHRITTWDQAQLDGLVGGAAVKYAEDHERDVRQLAREMWAVFPLGLNWWKIKSALGRVYAKNDAIRARAAKIGEQRRAGLVVERNGELVYASKQ